MSKLIALVAIAMLVNGERTEVQPGDEVTGLSPADADELKRIGSVQDDEELAADRKAADRAEKSGAAEFAKARKTIQATQSAIEAASR